MNTQALVQVARDIASRAHAGQVDKSGVEYICHPARVAAGVRAHGGDDAAVATAWLHDVLEDCEVTEADLGAAGIPVPVIEAVRAVTKREGETLEDYCARVRGNPTGLLVKRADIEDNTDPARTTVLSAATRERLAAKYARTRSLLGIPEPH